MEHNPEFLKDKYQLQHSDEVEQAAIRTEMREGEPVSQKPTERIQNYLDRFSEILDRKDEEKRTRGIEALRKVLHDSLIITEAEIPEATYLLEQRIARELGHGDIEITDEFRARKASEIIRNQERSLDAWITYLTSPDANYPDWAKYWAFRSVTEMGKLIKEEDEHGKESARFARRTKDSVASFPTLNPRALALTIETFTNRLEEKAKQKDERQPVANKSTTLTDEEFQQLVSSENFAKIYAQFLIELPEYHAEGLQNTNGKWVKYDRGTDPQPLVDSLDGHPLEWCTASYDTAKTQLELGDFYVYYSEDGEGNATIPRAAIRMEEDTIAEVRGIASNQHLDPYIAPVVGEKMKEFPDGAEYQKKVEDMKRLTLVETRIMKGEALSKEDLRFLYEIDAPIQGFGYEEDPRIEELLEGRDARADISFAIDCKPEEVKLMGDYDLDYVSGETKHYIYYSGNLNRERRHTSAEGLMLPKYVMGDLDLSGLTSVEGLNLPERIGGDLDLRSLKAAEGLKLPEYIEGSLYLNRLTSAEGLNLPERIGGDLNLGSLKTAEGLKLPEYVGGELNLGSLKTAEGLKLPEYVGGELELSSITSVKGAKLPKYVGKSLFLDRLSSTEGLKLPEYVGSALVLNHLTSAKGLVLPKEISGLSLKGLTSAEGLVLPKERMFALELNSLTSAVGLDLPKCVESILNLGGLTSAEGLVLPEEYGGDYLDLHSLTSAVGLKLPKRVGDLNLSGLTSVEGLILPEHANSIDLSPELHQQISGQDDPT